MPMNRYNFTSPGAAASHALLELLVEREAEKRQAMIDEIAREDRARRDLLFRQGQEDRAAKLSAIDEQAQREQGINQILAHRQASLNAAPGDPTGARATRDALNVVLRLAGAHKEADEAQKADDAAELAAAKQAAIEAYLQDPTDEGGANLKMKYGIDMPKPPKPDIRTVGGDLVELGEDGPRVLYRSPKEPRRTITPTAEAAQIKRLQDQWDNATKTAREVSRQFELMREGLQRFREGDKNGGSQAVLITFQKILDPTSVVRESEYARSAEGTSLISRIEGYVDRLSKGGAGVPERDLAAMVETARRFKEGAERSLAGVRRRTRLTAARYDIPTDLIFTDEDESMAPPPSGSSKPSKVGRFEIVGVQ